eukprot:Clim_evm81s144 gene=Clim_evmTU81s144
MLGDRVTSGPGAPSNPIDTDRHSELDVDAAYRYRDALGRDSYGRRGAMVPGNFEWSALAAVRDELEELPPDEADRTEICFGDVVYHEGNPVRATIKDTMHDIGNETSPLDLSADNDSGLGGIESTPQEGPPTEMYSTPMTWNGSINHGRELYQYLSGNDGIERRFRDVTLHSVTSLTGDGSQRMSTASGGSSGLPLNRNG